MQYYLNKAQVESETFPLVDRKRGQWAATQIWELVYEAALFGKAFAAFLQESEPEIFAGAQRDFLVFFLHLMTVLKSAAAENVSTLRPSTIVFDPIVLPISEPNSHLSTHVIELPNQDAELRSVAALEIVSSRIQESEAKSASAVRAVTENSEPEIATAEANFHQKLSDHITAIPSLPNESPATHTAQYSRSALANMQNSVFVPSTQTILAEDILLTHAEIDRVSFKFSKLGHGTCLNAGTKPPSKFSQPGNTTAVLVLDNKQHFFLTCSLSIIIPDRPKPPLAPNLVVIDNSSELHDSNEAKCPSYYFSVGWCREPNAYANYLDSACLLLRRASDTCH